MNLVIITGHICNDLEVKTKNDKLFLKFSVAVRKNYKPKDSQINADFVDVAVFGERAEFISKHFKKGDGIILYGQLNVNVYEKDGQKKKSTEVIVHKVEFPPTKKSTNSSLEKGIEVDDGDSYLDEFFDELD